MSKRKRLGGKHNSLVFISYFRYDQIRGCIRNVMHPLNNNGVSEISYRDTPL